MLMIPGWALAQEQAPITLTYQGSLANAAGEAINADRPMTFRLYTQAEGGDPRAQRHCADERERSERDEREAGARGRGAREREGGM